MLTDSSILRTWNDFIYPYLNGRDIVSEPHIAPLAIPNWERSGWELKQIATCSAYRLREHQTGVAVPSSRVSAALTLYGVSVGHAPIAFTSDLQPPWLKPPVVRMFGLSAYVLCTFQGPSAPTTFTLYFDSKASHAWEKS